MISNFINQDAIVKRLGTATKVKRSLVVGATVSVTKPQPRSEMDLTVGQHVLVWNFWTEKDTDIVQGDVIEVNGDDYEVLITMKNDEGAINFKKIKAVKERG